MSTSGDALVDKDVTPLTPAATTAAVIESADSSSDSSAGSESDSESNSSSSKGSQSSGTGSASGDNQSSASSDSAHEFVTPKATLQPVSIDFSEIGELPETNEVVTEAVEATHPPAADNLDDPLAPAQPLSPIVTTPGKSLSIQLPSSGRVKRNPSASDSTPVVVKVTQNLVATNQNEIEKSSTSAPLVAPIMDEGKVPKPTSTASSSSTSKAAVAPLSTSVIDTDKKSVRKEDKKNSEPKLTHDQRKAQRYQKKVLKLEKIIQKKDKDKAAKASRVVKDKKGKQPKKSKKKAKKATPVEASSEGLVSDESSSSVDSNVVGPPSRIGKLSHGRKLQQLSMARVKELGRLRNTDLNATQVSEALKVIDSIELDINPDQAYYLFHRVPGSGLPHMDKVYRNFCQRYCILVRAIVKFHLLQAQKLNNARSESLGPEVENPLVSWWQFLNDLSRAPSVTTHLQAPPEDDTGEPPQAKKPRTSATVDDKLVTSKSAKKRKSSTKKAEAAAELVLLAESIINKTKGRKRKKKKKQASSSSE